jgi:hypothetical protein
VTDPLPTEHSWRERRKYVEPLVKPSLCWLQRQRDAHQQPTLGVFKPRNIKRLLIEDEADPDWSEGELQILRQRTLFGDRAPKTELKKVPYKFSYEFECDDPLCKGHRLMCSDWEMGESWRKWSAEYGERWQEKFRQRYEREIVADCDTHFYVGTIHKNPRSWVIVGLFYPPKLPDTPLFSAL